MKVPFSYLPTQFCDVNKLLEEIRKAVKTCEFTLGPDVERFENRFATMLGVSHAVGVGSGTDALKLGLKALGVGFGDEVITSANTFIATVGAISELGAKPVLVDVMDYFTMNPDRIESAITEKTKALVPVHLAGEPADMPKIMSIAKKHHLPVVEDTCQAVLSEVDGKKAGTFGDVSGFSLHPLKALNVWGDGGMVLTQRPELDQQLRLLRNHGLKTRDEVLILGCNSRLDTLQAVVGNWLINDAADITQKRIENAAYYDERILGLSGNVRLPFRRPNVKRVFHLYIIFVKASVRDNLLTHLIDKGVDAKIHYPIPLFQQEGLAHLGYRSGDFPETEKQAQEMISLPLHQYLSMEQMTYAMDTLEEFFR